MCGIAGQIRFDGKPVSRDLLKSMADAMIHRGPDSEGFFSDGCVGLAFRRLSIIDLSLAGSQPMTNETGKVTMVLNGEVYNFEDHRPGLIERGHRFKSRTDTEVVLHRYEEVGERVVDDMRGMFAMALWDSERRRILLARDRMGKKPLFYNLDRSCLTFASELSSLLCEPTIERTVDRRALDTYLTYQYLPGELCLIPGVRKLLPAHLALFSPEGFTTRRYWSLRHEPKAQFSDDQELCDEIVVRLREAVKLRMVSDVPLGAFLSGGVDSSAVVALMSELSHHPVKTFTIGFAEDDYSELPYAREVARQFSTDHHEFIVRPEAVKILPLLVRHYGNPYADSSAIATYYVAQQTRRHVTVALNGDGGDESFAGYERYLAHRWIDLYRLVPRSLRAVSSRILGLLPDPDGHYSLLRRVKRFTSASLEPADDSYLSLVTCLDRTLRDRLYTPAMRESIGVHDSADILREAFSWTNARSSIDRMMAADILGYLPDDLLVKVDIATMMNSLEGRSPFLDHVLVEFAASIPANLKLRGTTTKYILKKALSRLLPSGILHRRKMGFGVPIKKWFRGELSGMLGEVLLDPATLARGYFRREVLETLIQEHRSGIRDHAYRLYTLLMLELWHREFVDGRAREPVDPIKTSVPILSNHSQGLVPPPFP